ncbi:MAG: hypothetical protein RLZZ589_1981, partial [Cyanobacteriota bacterium]
GLDEPTVQNVGGLVAPTWHHSRAFTLASLFCKA